MWKDNSDACNNSQEYEKEGGIGDTKGRKATGRLTVRTGGGARGEMEIKRNALIKRKVCVWGGYLFRYPNGRKGFGPKRQKYKPPFQYD